MATKIRGFAGLLRVLAVPRKAQCCSDAARSSQAHADLRSIYLLPPGASPAVGRSVLIVSDMRRAEHPQLRFAPCCCSYTEQVCGSGEALRLRLADVDLDNGVITIRETKFYKSRLVPLGRDIVQILRKYLATPGRWNQHYRPLFQIAATSEPWPRYGRTLTSAACASLREFAVVTRALVSRGFMTCGTRSPSTG